MGLAVGDVARLAGVSVRTLHHYDRVGLLQPGGRTSSGHRRYQEADLDRLQRILGYRELGFGLDEIAELLADGTRLLLAVGTREQNARLASSGPDDDPSLGAAVIGLRR